MKVQVAIISEIKQLRFKISKQHQLIDYYEQMSYSLGGADYSREIVDGTRDLRAPFEKWLIKKFDAEDKLKIMEKNLSTKVEELELLVEKIEHQEYQMVLTYRYVLNIDWNEIAKKMNYSTSTIFRLHRETLQELKKHDS